MKPLKLFISVLLLSIALCKPLTGQDTKLVQDAKDAMLSSTRFMVEKAGTNGGYVWNYLPDFTRRWGEMEAYKTMIWMQNPGTVSMGHLFLDAYKATGDEYYYQAATKAASAIIWGQSPEGGWNYIVDFAGDRSLKQWYNTIGKNGWRLEEFQHYYGNSTFDDDVSSNAATFNDGVIGENVNFLIQCHLTLGEERLPDPIRRGMNFYLVSQDSSGGWGQQLDMNLEAAGARTYEPKALLPRVTVENSTYLMTYYQYTGDKRFLARIPDAISWLVKHVSKSNPYIGDGQKQELTDEFASTNVGDETDTSPFRDESEQEYISTGDYIRNMTMLISYIKSVKTTGK
jgi:hypothetical protein